MPVSIKDIARVAGVSHPTVSRALRDSPLVAEATRQRVHEIARAMGYSPDTRARGLATGRTETIGVVVTSVADPFTAEVVEGIESAAGEAGHAVILASSGGDPARELQAVELLRGKRVDLVVVTSSRVGALYAEQFDRLGVPVVLINSHSGHLGDYALSVSVDNRHGGYLATQHLSALGHARIAYITGQAHHSDDTERQEGYRRALEEAGLVFDRSRIVAGDGTPAGGERALARLRAADPPPTAVFCYNDRTAIGLLRAARAAGLRVPRDLAVVGFDDVWLAAYIDPPLTTVAQPMRDLGRRAAEIGLGLLASGAAPDARGASARGASELLRGRLVVRGSCGASMDQGAVPARDT